MKIIYDVERVKRNANVAHTLTLGSIFILLASVGLPTIRMEMAPIGNLLLILGVVVAIAGMILSRESLGKKATTRNRHCARARRIERPISHVLVLKTGQACIANAFWVGGDGDGATGRSIYLPTGQVATTHFDQSGVSFFVRAAPGRSSGARTGVEPPVASGEAGRG